MEILLKERRVCAAARQAGEAFAPVPGAVAPPGRRRALGVLQPGCAGQVSGASAK